MNQREYTLQSKVFLNPGMAGWHFIAVPKKQSADIKKQFGSLKKGWGSLPVAVSLGTSSWKTSIFPDTKAGTYLLPLKAQIRKKRGCRQRIPSFSPLRSSCSRFQSIVPNASKTGSQQKSTI